MATTQNQPHTHRKICGCMGTKYPVINNCLFCGRIVCEAEGEGPCPFCGNPVYRPENMNEFEEQMSLMKEMEEDPALIQSYIKAVENKDKLIRYDKTDVARKNMYDEDTDWYEIKNDVWQSSEVRQHAMQKMIDIEDEEQFARENEFMSFDMKSGKMVTEEIKVDYKKHREDAAKYVLNNETKKKSNQGAEEEEVDLVEADARLKKKENEILAGISSKYQEDLSKNKIKVKGTQQIWKKAATTKVQHDDCYTQFQKALQKQQELGLAANQLPEEVYDKALYRQHPSHIACLSMWQPWASLLVYGFKRFEGRQWDTDYRGPLWIHAGSRQPSKEDIKQVEQHYKMLYKGVPKKDMPEFPSEYPTGCLIGLIDLQTVINQETYKEYIPKEYTKETTSEFLFVARNPRRLSVPIRMPGKRGIFDIDPQVCKTALVGLKRVPSNWFPYYADKLPKEEIPEVQGGNGGGEEAGKHMRKKIFTEVKKRGYNTGVGGLKLVDLVEKEKEQNLYEFMKSFESAFGKQLKEGKAGKFVIPYNSSLPRYELIHPLLTRFFEDVLQIGSVISEARAGNYTPNKMVVYSVTRFTNGFVLDENFKVLTTLGPKIEFIVEEHKLALNEAQFVSNSVDGLDVEFIRMIKQKKGSKSSGYVQKIGGGGLIIGFF